MATELVIYICPRCCEVFETRPEYHEHQIQPIRCRPGRPGDDRRKPVFNERGVQVSHAPRWYLEAIGVISPE